MEVTFSSSFKRAFKKRIQGNTDLEKRFWQKVEQFTLDPFNPSLKTHKLSGKLKELWSFSVDGGA
jgi:mRNA-degrading endonuclease YafQ of YafQ-DinJ toxin-antitoxin module